MKYVIWGLVILLLILHQDYWQWDNATIDFGFLPRALSYHVAISIGAAVVWWLATKFCWVEGLDESAEQPPGKDAQA